MARILICDDAIFMRATIRDFLEKGGHEVVGDSESPEQALELYKKLKLDLVTMDILMETSGVEGIKALKGYDPAAKIIIITVLSSQEGEVVEAVKAGAEGLVLKPIKKEALLEEVARVIG